MVDVSITLSGLWIALMLPFCWGTCSASSRVTSPMGELAGKPATQGMWLRIAAIMLTPIIMVVLSLVLPSPAIRWICIVVAAIWVIFVASSRRAGVLT